MKICTVTGCEKPQRHNSPLCHMHNKRKQLYGDPDLGWCVACKAAVPRPAGYRGLICEKHTCALEGCVKRVSGRRRDAVYCSESHRRTAASRTYRAAAWQRKWGTSSPTFECGECGLNFTAVRNKTGAQLYCSKKCFWKSWIKAHGKKKHCLWCHIEFITTTRDPDRQKTCSKKCAGLFRWRGAA